MSNRITEQEIVLISFVMQFLPLFPEKPGDDWDHNNIHRAVDFMNTHEDLLDCMRKIIDETK